MTPRTVTTYVDSPIAGAHHYVVRAFSSGWESPDGNEATARVTAVSLADSWQTGLTHVAGSGSDRALVFVASNEQQTTMSPMLSSVSFGGQPLTPVLAEQVADGCCTASLEVWLLDEAGIAAATGSGITVSWTSAPDAPLYSHAIFEQVDQISPTGAMTSASVIGDTPNPVPLSSVATSKKDMVIGAATAGETGSYTPPNGFLLSSTLTRRSLGVPHSARATSWRTDRPKPARCCSTRRRLHGPTVRWPLRWCSTSLRDPRFVSIGAEAT